MEIGTTYRLRTPKTGLGEGGGRTQLQLKYLYIQNLYKISIEKYDWSDVIWKQVIKKSCLQKYQITEKK